MIFCLAVSISCVFLAEAQDPQTVKIGLIFPLTGPMSSFGEDMAKSETLPSDCRECEYLTDCWGECPKNRILRTKEGELGLNYLCRGFKKYFAHALPKVKKITAKLKSDPAQPRNRMDLK